MGFGTLGTAINIVATIISMRCRGMTLREADLTSVDGIQTVPAQRIVSA